MSLRPTVAPKVYLFSPWRLWFARSAVPATREASDSPTFWDARLFCPFVGFLSGDHVAQLNYQLSAAVSLTAETSRRMLFLTNIGPGKQRDPSLLPVLPPGALLLMQPFNVLYGWCPFQTRECKTCKNRVLQRSSGICWTDPCFFFFMSVETEMQLDTAELWSCVKHKCNRIY